MEELVKFTCNKEVEARPMNRGEYNSYRNWTIPANENPDDAGFLVVYADGYESWSPEKVFNEGYYPSNCPLSRIKAEKAQLETRIENLRSALESGVLEKFVSKLQIKLMGTQLRIMDGYLAILNERLEFWGVK